MARFHVGVDVGRTQHVARLLDTNTAHMSRSFQIPVSHEGFERFRRYLECFSPNPQDFFVAIEATGAYHVALAGYLWDYGYTLALVNPTRAKAFRKAEGHVAKTDRVDAGVLCRMVAGLGLRPTAPKPKEQERLRVLTRWYFRLQQNRTRALNRVSAAVDVVFPEFWQVFSEITQVTPRLVLQTYGTPNELVRADTEAVAGLLRRVSRGRYGRKDAEYLQNLASRTVGILNLHEPVAFQIRQALTQVDLIDRQIRELEALLSDRRVELADLKAVTECVDDLRSLLNENTLAERKSFIRSFVKEVKVTGEDVELTYTMPLPPEGISQERLRVLHSVHSSGDGVTIGRTFELVFSLTF